MLRSEVPTFSSSQVPTLTTSTPSLAPSLQEVPTRSPTTNRPASNSITAAPTHRIENTTQSRASFANAWWAFVAVPVFAALCIARWFLSKSPKKTTNASVQNTNPVADAVISKQPYQVSKLPFEVEVEDLPFDVEVEDIDPPFCVLGDVETEDLAETAGIPVGAPRISHL